jgi:hypothetical protein
VKARKAACGYCGELRAVRLDGRFREHAGTGGRRCAGGGRVVAITAGEAQPGDVIEFVTGRQARVATVLVPPPADSAACYVTICHDTADVPAGSPVLLLTVCFADTLVRLAGTTAAAPAPADEGVAA